MTTFINFDNEIEIIDVEKIMSEVVGADETISDDLVDSFTSQNADYHSPILVADDSSVIRNHIKPAIWLIS